MCVSGASVAALYTSDWIIDPSKYMTTGLAFKYDQDFACYTCVLCDLLFQQSVIVWYAGNVSFGGSVNYSLLMVIT